MLVLGYLLVIVCLALVVWGLCIEGAAVWRDISGGK